MELLNFKKLEEMWKSVKVTENVEVSLFSKDGESIRMVDGSSNEYLVQNKAKGTVGEVFSSGNRIYVGIGELSPEDGAVLTTETAFKIQKAMKNLFLKLKNYSPVRISFVDSVFYTRHAIYALIMVGYNYDFLKKNKETSEFFLEVPKELEETAIVAHAQNTARFLGDTPANLMTPVLFEKYAAEFLKGIENIQFESLGKDEMKRNNMGLLLGVTNGSIEEPRLISLKYKGDSTSDILNLAMVGKGVTFDAGGISLKPAAGMADMKFDMMGAATLLATFKIISQLKLKINVSGTFAMVENLPSGSATKPGDVHVGMAGISVEVDNTDAEGRLILADALAYAQRENPEYIIDAATLTGAMVISLGNVYGGFFSNNDGFAELISSASKKSYDLLWRMPLSDHYRPSMDSFVADIKNIGGRGAGSAKAAVFLKEFVSKESKWAHFDIAGLMNDSNLSEVYGKDATGRPVPAFFEIAKQLENK